MKTNCEISVSYKSRLESDYADRMGMLYKAGEFQSWGYERIKLRVGKGAYYTPDFDWLDNNGQVHFDETKGYRREAAIIRLKAAAMVYPMFRFRLVTRNKEGWQYEEVN